MTIYVVTSSNWNDPSFWSGISETVSGHTLDFSALVSNFAVDFDPTIGTISIFDGTTTFTIGDTSAGGSPDVVMAGTTSLNFFTTLEGTQGEDDFLGTAGNDTIDAGGGDDTVNGGYGNDLLEGGDGNDDLSGDNGDDTLIGGSGADSLYGNYGDDSLVGGDGDDLFQGEEGDDTMVGGLGTDTFNVSDQAEVDQIDGGESVGDADSLNFISSEPVVVSFTDLESGSYTYTSGGGASGTFTNIEHFESASGLDTLDMSALPTGVTVTFTDDFGGTITDGTTTITFSGFEKLILTDDADVVDASVSLDGIHGDQPGIEIVAGDGDDTITGGRGGDTIDGGGGNDSIDGGYGDDILDGNDGSDFIQGGVQLGDDSVDGGAGDDTFVGGVENDTISGGAGDDSLDGGDADDSLLGGDGADTIIGGTGDDYIEGGDGDDSLLAGDGQDTLIGGAGNDTLRNSSGDDSLVGGAGDDSIVATFGDDTLEGGDGNDTLEGGQDDDLLTGGDGDDVFVYDAGDGNDTITDFNFGNTGTLDDTDSTNNDFIDLTAFYDSVFEIQADQADDGILNQSNTDVDYTDNDSFGNGGITVQGASSDNSSYTSENTGVVCFTSGTAIMTPLGDILVEDLRVGDLVTTMDNGPQRIRWIGTRALGKTELTAAPHLRPVLIKRGVLGVERDLFVSPQHGMLVGGDVHLARAKHLAETLKGVRIAHGKMQVTYFHLMFEKHEVIFAEKAPSESFYPGPMGLKMMDSAARDEVYSLFPGIMNCTTKQATQSAYGETARGFIHKREIARCLLT